MLLILLFILILNVVAIGLTYYCLEELEQKEKIIFIAVGVAVIYMLTSFVYWISTKNIEVQEVAETGKNIITFLFVPINGIIVLPILAKSYAKYKKGGLAVDKLRNRVIALLIPLIIVLVFEGIYFKDIQNTVIDIIKTRNQTSAGEQKNTENKINTMLETTAISNQTSSNQINQERTNESALVNTQNMVNEM